MPNVTAIPRWFGDEEVTQVVDTVGTTETTYTFPKSQEYFKITNTGHANILVSVGGLVDVIVSPGNSWSREVSSVDIKLKASSGAQSFELKGINYREQLMQVMGSNITLPMDLQYHNLSDLEPLPTKKAYPSVVEKKIATNIQLGPGVASVITDIDLTDCDSYFIGLIASASHAFEMTGQRRSDDLVEYFDIDATAREQIMIATSSRKLSDEFKPKTPKLRLYLKNSDATLTITYNIWIFKRR